MKAPLGTFRFYALALSVGVVSGCGALIFRGLIGLFHNLLFLGQFSFAYNANVHTPPSPWGPFIILVPVIGAVGVAFLVTKFAPEAKGHGVPEVMDAVYYNKGIIRPIVAVIKALASALSIGSGGSVGREGPFVQIGSSFGSTIAQIFKLPLWQRITLIAAGAGAGIAVAFNTPVGGLLFAVEIVMHEVSARTLVPVAIATITASYLGRIFFGAHPSFVIPALETHYFHHTQPLVLLLYVVLGVLMGLVSMLYIWAIYAAEDFFETRVSNSYYVRHMLGMLTLGIIMYGLLVTSGHYYVEGVGYSTIQDILTGSVSWFLVVLFALKLVATSLTLGSGASGGIFSPGLFLGATLGGTFGMVMHWLFPHLPIESTTFAVAGMAGVIGGSTGAALTAIVMIFEMTLDYTVIIPMTITVALSYGLRKMLHPQSIYTEKLARRGRFIPDELQANFYQLKKASDVMDTDFATLPAAATFDDFVKTARERPSVWTFLIGGPSGTVGFLKRGAAFDPAATVDGQTPLGDMADHKFVCVDQGTPLMDVMTRLRKAKASIAIVTDGNGAQSSNAIHGVIARPQIANAVLEEVELHWD